jgi:signal transduction histidine kinase
MKILPASTLLVSAFATRRRWVLLALLAVLHAVLLLGPADPLARTLFIVHLGLVILWQPIFRAEQEINPVAVATIGALSGLAAYDLDWWLVSLWLLLLAGLVGGKVVLLSGGVWSKVRHLVALGYLVAALLLLVVPHMVAGALPAGSPVLVLGRAGLPFAFLVMALLPAGSDASGDDEVIDVVYSVFIFLLLSVLVLGSLSLMLLSGRGYAQSLIESLLLMGAVLLLLGWLWNPHAGFGGLGAMFTLYVLSVGLPVERWLHTLADLAQRQEEPDRFVAEACNEMARRLPWVAGGDWSAGANRGTFGVARGQRSEFHYEDFSMGIYTRHPLGPSLLWHFNLLAQLVGEFHADKVRARELKQFSYLRAVYETGARLTHDVKNLLQSLRALCAGTDGQADTMPPEFVALLRRQLPAITQRLEQTIEKLQVPKLEDRDHSPADKWWRELGEHFSASGVEFSSIGELAGLGLPAPLFSNVAENLLENALTKRRLAPALRICACLTVADDGGLSLEIWDDGEAIPPRLAIDLLNGPVPSENGLGIGLYQAARLAELSGYRLLLVENRPGGVCFRLVPATTLPD